MLEKIFIKNYAIIDELTIQFDKQLNVITGETGAGKSIIIGALSLILGDRADTSVLINKEEKCIVEAVFQLKNKKGVLALLEQEGLDAEEETIIRREINTNGKSRAFVNDSPVNLSLLNAITDHLVDLHRQFDQYLLKNGGFVYEIMDAVAENQKDLNLYHKAFATYQDIEHDLTRLKEKQRQQQQEADYKQFLFDELETAQFKSHELEEVAEELDRLNHREQILQTLQKLKHYLSEAEEPLTYQLRQLEQDLKGLNQVLPQADELEKRIESARLELEDIAAESQKLSQDFDLDPSQMEELQERLDLGYRLMKKHQVDTTDGLIDIWKQLQLELEDGVSLEDHLLHLEKQQQVVLKEVKHLADKLHQARLKTAPVFAQSVNKLLHLIGLPNATFKVAVTSIDRFNERGNSEVAFLWDANKSGQFQVLQKTASGGELSRIMLCIKALTAEAIDLPTLIFDEVDTGISGEAAKQVGLLLRKLSHKHQVLCITHQAQVAGKGQSHYYVYKEPAASGKIETNIRKLKPKERVMAIAQMIGGDPPSEAALKNAKELVEEA